jgi:molecular chaperone GrpE
MKKENTATKENIEDKVEEIKQDKTDKKEKKKKGKTPDENSSKDEKSESDKKEEKKLSTEEQLKQDLNDQKDKYLRLFAELENYKRRTSKERLELFKTASQELMQVMLPVLDDFDRALKEIKKSEDDSLVEGVELINNKFRETLKSKGLEPMAVKEGDIFDADIHEAVTQIPAPDKSMKGKIVDVVEKGYTLGDKIIRYPKVVTGK